MPTRSFRFVHAGDFHLERPLAGVAEVPDHLRRLFLDAPYTAVRNLFEAVRTEDADFVVLSGDLLHPLSTGPRGPLFLVEQFARLAERGIGVYWAGGTVDPPDAWPAALALPSNVHVFPAGRIEELMAHRHDEPLARLAGASGDPRRALRPGDFSPDPTGQYSIAVGHGEADAAAMQARGVHYWALGGRHDRSTLLGGPAVVHYCGSPQGRRPEEAGVHGCTLVQVDGQCGPHTPCADVGTRSVPATNWQTRTTLIPTDSVRWLSERIAVDETTSREDLETRLRDRVHSLLEAAPTNSPLPQAGEGQGVRADDSPATRPHPNPLPAGEGTDVTTALLISWTVAGRGPMIAQLRRGGLAADLLDWLRTDFGYRTPAAWTVSLQVELSETLPPEWYEQETIRGDFLRAVRHFQMNPDEPLALDGYLAEAHLAGTLGSAVALDSRAVRERVLREAAALGVELLSGEESHA